MQIDKLTIGADPELFVVKGRHVLSGHLFPCGTKQQPLQTEHGYVQVDGIALEVNVTPASTRPEFVTNVANALGDLSRIVRGVEPAAALVAAPSIFFGRRRLSALPVENSELGCTPDYSAYTGRRNLTPDRTLPIRTGAGHIHIGWTKDQNPRDFKFFKECAAVARQLDYYLGLPSILWDKDTRRRSLYGQAGAFRPKSYGVEYRVLSNAWLAKQELVGWVFDRTVAALTGYAAGRKLDQEFKDLAQNIINSGNTMWPESYPALAQAVAIP